MEKGNNIELRTDEVRDILQKMPHWTIRWGITIIFGVVALLLVFSYLYRYPDLIRSEVVVSASNPPAEIKARSSGKITNLLIENDARVSKGQLLAVVENPANIQHIGELQNYLTQLELFIRNFDENNYTKAPQALVLGDVQNAYSELQKLVDDYIFFTHQKYYAERIAAIDGQMDMKAQMLDRLAAQQLIEGERHELARQSFNRDSQLNDQTIISQEDFEDSRSEWLNAGLTLETVKKEQVSTRSSIYELQQQKAGLQLEYDNELKAFQTNISKAYELVKSTIGKWYQNYALISPIDGKVSFNKVWAANQNVSLGETVLTIVPENPLGILAKAYVPVVGAGKVKPGQKVNIKLSNYPYMEYGMLIGKVKRKAPVPVNNVYAIEIELPNRLTTSYGHTLDMQQELFGNCEIITDDLRLIQRIVYPIKAVIERNRR